MAEIIKSGRSIYLHINGFLYYKHSNGRSTVRYWKCRRKDQCPARATTENDGHTLKIIRGGNLDEHSHAPNREEVEALRVLTGIKRKASEHPDMPPVRIMQVLQDVPNAVLAELPDRENIRKRIQRERLKEMPANPRTIQELQEIPEKFQVTSVGDAFLLYDTFNDDNYNLQCGRIVIFSSSENLRALNKSRSWFVDGTFKTAPIVFFQLLVIMGSVEQIVNGSEQTIALPFVYALLESKTQEAYSKVFEVTMTSARNLGIQITPPQFVMCDFELAIINAANSAIGDVVRACLFHLCQSVYRRIQAEGLQERYNDEEDRSIKQATQMMCATAFVPVDRVLEFFDAFMDDAPEDFIPVADYFEVTYVRGKKAQGRRKAVNARYPPKLWNQYDAVLQHLSRTNNASEGWHNRFQTIVGRYHPSLYAFLTELQREQGDTEAMLRQLSLGQKIRKPPEPRRRIIENRIFNVVSQFQNYIDEDDFNGYLRSIGCNLHF